MRFREYVCWTCVHEISALPFWERKGGWGEAALMLRFYLEMLWLNVLEARKSSDPRKNDKKVR